MAKGKKTGKKKFYEIFEFGKKGKERVVKAEGFESEKKGVAKEKSSDENRILRNIFIAIGIIVVVIVASYFILNSMNSFSYKGVEFKTVKFCDVKPCLIVYQTKLPVILENGEKAEYNFYLRNDPRELANVSFLGELNMIPNVVISASEDFNCNGDGIIAMANLVNLYKVLGANVMKNETLGCSQSGDYMSLNIVKGDKNKVVKVGLACYSINVNECGILKSTERFMLETFVKVNAALQS